MAKITLDFKYPMKVSAKDVARPDNSMPLRMMKMMEELGELSGACLKKIGSYKASKTAENNVLEEGTDMLQCIMNLLWGEGHTNEEIQETLLRKTVKWEKKVDGTE